MIPIPPTRSEITAMAAKVPPRPGASPFSARTPTRRKGPPRIRNGRPGRSHGPDHRAPLGADRIHLRGVGAQASDAYALT